MGTPEVHGRGPSRPRACFCSALGVDGVACGLVAAHPEPANATTTLNAERIDVRVSGRPRESLSVGRRRTGEPATRCGLAMTIMTIIMMIADHDP